MTVVYGDPKPGEMTITAHGTRKSANKAHLDPPTGPALAKTAKDTIAVCNESSKPTSHASEAQQRAPSQIVTRTPPQQQARPPTPGAPNKPAHRATVLSDLADTDDEESDTRANGNPRKAEKQASIAQALCTIRDKLTAMRTSGYEQHDQGGHTDHPAGSD